MASRSLTTSTPFHHLPLEEKHLLQVCEGVEAHSALSLADVLSVAVQELLFDAVDEANAVTGNLAFLCEFAMDAAKGLRKAAGAVA